MINAFTHSKVCCKRFKHSGQWYLLGAGLDLQKHVEVYGNVGGLHHEAQPGAHPWTAGRHHKLLVCLAKQLHPNLHHNHTQRLETQHMACQ